MVRMRQILKLTQQNFLCSNIAKINSNHSSMYQQTQNREEKNLDCQPAMHLFNTITNKA